MFHGDNDQEEYELKEITLSQNREPFLAFLLHQIITIKKDFTDEEIREIDGLIKEANPQNYSGFIRALKQKFDKNELIALKPERLHDVLAFIKLNYQLEYFLPSVYLAARDALMEQGKKRTLSQDDVLPIVMLLLPSCDNSNFPLLKEELDKLFTLNNKMPTVFSFTKFSLVTLFSGMIQKEEEKKVLIEKPESQLEWIEIAKDKANQFSFNDIEEKKADIIDELVLAKKGASQEIVEDFDTLFVSEGNIDIDELELPYNEFHEESRRCCDYLKSAANDFCEELAQEILETLKKDNLALYLACFSRTLYKDLTEENSPQDLVKHLVQLKENEKHAFSPDTSKRLINFTEKNTKFNIKLEKFEVAIQLQDILEEKNKDPRDKNAIDAVKAFEEAFSAYEKTLKQSEDSPTKKFCKRVAEAFSFGLASKLWGPTKADQFLEKVKGLSKKHTRAFSSLFPTVLKRAAQPDKKPHHHTYAHPNHPRKR